MTAFNFKSRVISHRIKEFTNLRLGLLTRMSTLKQARIIDLFLAHGLNELERLERSENPVGRDSEELREIRSSLDPPPKRASSSVDVKTKLGNALERLEALTRN